MRVQRFGTFIGGIDLTDEKLATRDQALAPVAPPPVLRVPLDPCGRGDVRPAVQPGQAIRRGELLGLAAGLPVLAPLDGRVSALTTCRLPSESDPARLCPAVELTDLQAGPAWTHQPPSFPWREADPATLLERFDAGGLTRLRRPVEPLAQWCRRARAAKVDTLIANGVENEPALTADHRLLVEQGPAIVRGLAILARVLAPRRAMIAVDHRRTDEYRHIIRPAHSHDIQTVAVLHKYPVGQDVMLTHVLTGRETPLGRSPLAAKVAVVGVAEALAVYRWTACDQPVVERAVTIAGDGVGRPGNCLVPYGTPIRHLLNVTATPMSYETLCHGGPMTGQAVTPDAVVGPACPAVLALGPRPHEAASACIRCSWCTDHCPVRLNVANLNDLFELGQLDRAVRHGVAACIGCGVCSYICPARLPLTHRMKTLQRAARAQTERAAPPA